MRKRTRFLLTAALMLAVAEPSHAEPANAVFVLTYLDLQPKGLSRGAALLKKYRTDSRKEDGAGNIGLAVETGRPNRLLIVETWQSRDAFLAHERAGAKFRSALDPLLQSPPDRRVHADFSSAPGTVGGAVIVATHVDVIPPKQKETEALLKKLAAPSRKEAGNIIFDVFQQDGHANHFGVLAAWKSHAAFERHQNATQTMEFRKNLAPLLGALYDERLYRPIE